MTVHSAVIHLEPGLKTQLGEQIDDRDALKKMTGNSGKFR